MDLPEPLCAGFALAATIAGDKGAQCADEGLHSSVRAALTALPRELASLDRTARRDRARALAARAPRNAASGGNLGPEQAGRPPRALALLAPHADRELARTWAAAAPALPRPGYIPEPTLLLRLRALARCPSKG